MRQGPIFTRAERNYLEARALLAHAMSADNVSPEHLAKCRLEYQQACEALRHNPQEVKS